MRRRNRTTDVMAISEHELSAMTRDLDQIHNDVGMPAMNNAPIEVLVETPYSTRMIEGGTRMPSAPDVEMTPTPNRRG